MIADGVQNAQAQVLQLPLDAAHAQAVGDGRVDLHGLKRLIALLALGQVLEGARIVQAVGQLDEDDADILGHGHEHLAQVLKLFLLFGVAQHTQSGDAVHQLGDRCAEFIFNLAVSKIGVLDAVMQQAGTDRVSIQAHLNDDLGHSDRMDDIGFAVAALLAFVCLGRAFISGANLFDVGRGVLLLHPLDQEIDPVFHRSAHNFDTSFYSQIAVPCAGP